MKITEVTFTIFMQQSKVLRLTKTITEYWRIDEEIRDTIAEWHKHGLYDNNFWYSPYTIKAIDFLILQQDKEK